MFLFAFIYMLVEAEALFVHIHFIKLLVFHFNLPVAFDDVIHFLDESK